MAAQFYDLKTVDVGQSGAFLDWLVTEVVFFTI